MRRVLSLVAVLSVVLPVAARAQSASVLADVPVSVSVSPAVAVPVSALASLSDAPVSVTAAGQRALAQGRFERTSGRGVPGMAPGKSFGQAEALMIVGGAAILGGILVGGNVGYVVSVVGLGAGLYGLWLYLK